MYLYAIHFDLIDQSLELCESENTQHQARERQRHRERENKREETIRQTDRQRASAFSSQA